MFPKDLKARLVYNMSGDRIVKFLQLSDQISLQFQTPFSNSFFTGGGLAIQPTRNPYDHVVVDLVCPYDKYPDANQYS